MRLIYNNLLQEAMKRAMIKSRLIALMMATALLLTACGASGASTPSGGALDRAPVSQAGEAQGQDLSAVLAETEDSITLEDALAGTVTIPKEPERVVILLNSVLDLWYMAGGTAVGRVTGTDNLPEEAAALPEVGGSSTPSVETILSLEPDLVILVNTITKHREIQPALEQAGVATISVRYKTYDDFLDLLDLFTRMTNRRNLYEEQSRAIARAVDGILEEAAEYPAQDVFIAYVTADYVKAGVEQSVVGDMVTRLGGNNIITAGAQNGQSAVDFSMEAVIAGNPGVILIQLAMANEDTEQKFLEELESNPAWAGLDAVINGRVYVVPRAYATLKPNARYPEAFLYIARCLYGEAFYGG